MPVRPVRIYGDPVLRQKALPVSAVDDTVRQLIEDMRATMKAYHGVGLAANQVGVAQRIALVDVPDENGGRSQFALINPVITSRSGSEVSEEGCLSIPGIFEDVTRALSITLEAIDDQGRALKMKAEGYLARAVQHEVDHLDGILFVDRLSLLKRQFLRRSLDALARGDLPEGYAPSQVSGGGG